MNKQVFTVGIYLPPDTSKVSELRLGESIRKGYKEHFRQELINLFVMENNVEQSCGTPINSSKKLFDLLREASDILEESDYAKDRNVAYKIQDYLVSIGEEI